MTGSITILIVTEIPVFAVFVFPFSVGILLYYTFGHFLNLGVKNRFLKNIFLRFLNNKSVAEIATEAENKENFYQIVLIATMPILFLGVVLFIPEYRELARVEFDGSKMYFKNVYGAMLTEPTLYADILEVSTEIRANHSKQIMVSTLRGDYISSHMTDEKTINLVQTQVLKELHSHGVQPFSGQR